MSGQTNKARQGGGDQDHFGHRRAVAQAFKRNHQTKPLIGDERERVRRINRLRGNHRDYVFKEIVSEPSRLVGIKRLVANKHNVLLSQQHRQFTKALLLRSDQLAHGFLQIRNLL